MTEWSLDEVVKMEKEIAPLVDEYIFWARSAKEFNMSKNNMRRLLELSSKLEDYYVFQKEWDNPLDFLTAMRKAVPFDMYLPRDEYNTRYARIKRIIKP